VDKNNIANSSLWYQSFLWYYQNDGRSEDEKDNLTLWYNWCW